MSRRVLTHKGPKIRGSQVTCSGELFWLEQSCSAQSEKELRALDLGEVSHIFEQPVVHHVCQIQGVFLKVSAEYYFYYILKSDSIHGILLKSTY